VIARVAAAADFIPPDRGSALRDMYWPYSRFTIQARRAETRTGAPTDSYAVALVRENRGFPIIATAYFTFHPIFLAHLLGDGVYTGAEMYQPGR
jgi:hypothetical protein